MKIPQVTNINYKKNSFKSRSQQDKPKDATIDVLDEIKKENKNNKIALYLIGGLIAVSSVAMFIRTDPTRIKKIATNNPLKNIKSSHHGRVEIEVKNFAKDTSVKSLDELSGLEKIKELFNEYQIITKNPEVKKEHNIQNYSSLLFWGVTGTGKTTAAKGIAKKLNADYIQIDKELFDSMYISEGSQRLAEVIDQIELYANKNSKKPIVVFMDEIDGTISIDRGLAARHSEDLTNTLKKGMTYLQEKCENVIFIGATNKDPSGIKSDNIYVRLNPAILSRFKYQIEISLPHEEAIIDAWTKLVKTASGKNKFTNSENKIISQHFYKLGMSYRDIECVADKLNRLDAVEFCQTKKYNSKQNLIKAILSDEKIGYDSVKKESLPIEKLQELITSLKNSLK